MDGAHFYSTRLRLLYVVIVLSVIGVVVLATIGLVQDRALDQRIVAVAHLSTWDADGAARFVFTSDDGHARTVRLFGYSGSKHHQGEELRVSYPPGRPGDAAVADQPEIPFACGGGLLLVGPALALHEQRTRARLALCRKPTNRQPTDVEIRTTKIKNGTVSWAWLSPAGSGLPPHLHVQLRGGQPLPASGGMHAGEVAGDLRPGGTVVLWIGGRPIAVAGNLRG